MRPKGGWEEKRPEARRLGKFFPEDDDDQQDEHDDDSARHDALLVHPVFSTSSSG